MSSWIVFFFFLLLCLPTLESVCKPNCCREEDSPWQWVACDLAAYRFHWQGKMSPHRSANAISLLVSFGNPWALPLVGLVWKSLICAVQKACGAWFPFLSLSVYQPKFPVKKPELNWERMIKSSIVVPSHSEGSSLRKRPIDQDESGSSNNGNNDHTQSSRVSEASEGPAEVRVTQLGEKKKSYGIWCIFWHLSLGEKASTWLECWQQTTRTTNV